MEVVVAAAVVDSEEVVAAVAAAVVEEEGLPFVEVVHMGLVVAFPYDPSYVEEVASLVEGGPSCCDVDAFLGGVAA